MDKSNGMPTVLLKGLRVTRTRGGDIIIGDPHGATTPMEEHTTDKVSVAMTPTAVVISTSNPLDRTNRLAEEPLVIGEKADRPMQGWMVLRNELFELDVSIDGRGVAMDFSVRFRGGEKGGDVGNRPGVEIGRDITLKFDTFSLKVSRTGMDRIRAFSSIHESDNQALYAAYCNNKQVYK